MRGVIFHNRSFRLLATALALAVLLASLPAVAVNADTPTPAAGRAPNRGVGLASVLKAEQAWLARQGEQLEKANEALAKALEMLAAAKGEKVNASALEAALASFKAGIAKAQAAHDKAAQILAAHKGFDDQGNVVNMREAQQTLREARRAMLEAHQLTLRAVQELRRGVRGWRGNRPTATPRAS